MSYDKIVQEDTKWWKLIQPQYPQNKEIEGKSLVQGLIGQIDLIGLLPIFCRSNKEEKI